MNRATITMEVQVGCEHFTRVSYNHNVKILDSDFLEWQNMETVKESNKKGKMGLYSPEVAEVAGKDRMKL